MARYGFDHRVRFAGSEAPMVTSSDMAAKGTTDGDPAHFLGNGRFGHEVGASGKAARGSRRQALPRGRRPGAPGDRT
jgi:hypothetical protein